MNRTERIAAAKERMLARYHDRDEAEANRMESFRGLSKDELRQRFEQAAQERGIKLAQEKEKQQQEVAGH